MLNRWHHPRRWRCTCVSSYLQGYVGPEKRTSSCLHPAFTVWNDRRLRFVKYLVLLMASVLLRFESKAVIKSYDWVSGACCLFVRVHNLSWCYLKQIADFILYFIFYVKTARYCKYW